MKAFGIISCGLVAFVATAFGADDFLDRIDEALTMTTWHDLVRALRLEELADLVRHIDEPVRRHGALRL